MPVEDERVLVLEGEAPEGVWAGGSQVGPAKQGLEGFNGSGQGRVLQDVVNVLTGGAEDEPAANFEHVGVGHRSKRRVRSSH